MVFIVMIRLNGEAKVWEVYDVEDKALREVDRLGVKAWIVKAVVK